MSDDKVEIVPEDNLQADHPAMVNGIFHTSLEKQSDPVVGHEELAPASKTIGVEELKQKEEEAKVYLKDKVQEVEKYLDDLMVELNERKEEVIKDGRSVFDNIVGHAKRLLARLK